MSGILEIFAPKNFEEVEEVKKKLRECKDEWLERKPGPGNITYISHNTIRQILDNAVKGITYWDFNILEQWKEEIWAVPKGGGQPYFDGYVYHVKGSMYIPGVGRREQYGSKVAVGGKSNQDSAYKAAASNCFNKCASLFGVGAEIYDKIKVEDDEEIYDQQQEQPYQNNQSGQPYQQQQNMNQQQNQQAFHMQQQNYQQPQNNGFQQQQQPQQNFQNQQQFGGQAGNFNQGQQQTPQPEPVVDQGIEHTMVEVDRMMQNGETINTPFNVEAKQEATVNQHQVAVGQAATPNEYQAQTVEYGAPTQEEPAQEKSTKVESNESQGTNPWQEQGVIKELQAYAAHKKRLNAETDEQMIAYLRDYFKDEKADYSYLTPENISSFNAYLNNISV